MRATKNTIEVYTINRGAFIERRMPNHVSLLDITMEMIDIIGRKTLMTAKGGANGSDKLEHSLQANLFLSIDEFSLAPLRVP